MDNIRITVIIVVYNREVSESTSIKNIKKISDTKIIVVDNSTTKNDNIRFCVANNINYISMGGNKGISKAYNAAIDSIEDTDIVVLLDDDTKITNDYFDVLKKAAIKNTDVDIFAPIVRGQDGVIYSPNNYNFLKNKLVTNPISEVRQDSFNAISSCMAIRIRVFDNYRYNEKLFVDEIDHCFCREQRARGKKFGILNVEIKQNFHQREEKIAADVAWNRVRIRILDIFKHSRLMGGGKNILLAFIKCCGLALQIGNKSNSIAVTSKVVALSCKLLFVDE